MSIMALALKSVRYTEGGEGQIEAFFFHGNQLTTASITSIQYGGRCVTFDVVVFTLFRGLLISIFLTKFNEYKSQRTRGLWGTRIQITEISQSIAIEEIPRECIKMGRTKRIETKTRYNCPVYKMCSQGYLCDNGWQRYEKISTGYLKFIVEWVRDRNVLMSRVLWKISG